MSSSRLTLDATLESALMTFEAETVLLPSRLDEMPVSSDELGVTVFKHQLSFSLGFPQPRCKLLTTACARIIVRGAGRIVVVSSGIGRGVGYIVGGQLAALTRLLRIGICVSCEPISKSVLV